MTKYIILLFVFSFWLFALPVGVFAQTTQTATLSLDPATGTFNRGCNYSLNVNLDTGGSQTDGADAILIYDPSRFNVTSIAKGTIFPDYPGNTIDSQNGKVTVSGLASVSTPFSGKGLLATVNLTVQSNAPPGATQIRFDFDSSNKANTRDSNVVERGTLVDVLNSAVDGNYTIGTGACGGQVAATPVPTKPIGAPIATPAAILETKEPVLPPAGSEQLTFTLAIVGVALTLLGILGLAVL
ncbi:hypothetical protein HYU95_00475 [Candidatus Daviesbacteria bacterium]|nr:hypothetical protein [Candidatus Daviesbacteria bacterium]